MISVIVPVYEHWQLVPALLDCLQAQTLPRKAFEVLLVDNGSTHFAPPERLPPNVQVHVCNTPGSYAARNEGIARARGEWLVFTDADCLPQPDWLENLIMHVGASGQPPALIAGAISMVGHHPKPNAYAMYDLVKGIPQALYVSRGYAATANLAMSAAVVRSLNGFDATRFAGSDADLCRRAVAAGHRLVYVPGAIVEHPARDTWQALVIKARRTKGGQLTTGARQRRLFLLLRTFTPPLIAFWRFLHARHAPLPYRLIAIVIQVRIWGVELQETARLAFSATAERR